VVGIVSDGQHAIRQAVAAVFPGTPYQLCQFHFPREAARPIYEADRHAKKGLKKKVRGVRKIERQMEDRSDPEAEAGRGYWSAGGAGRRRGPGAPARGGAARCPTAADRRWRRRG